MGGVKISSASRIASIQTDEKKQFGCGGHKIKTCYGRSSPLGCTFHLLVGAEAMPKLSRRPPFAIEDLSFRLSPDNISIYKPAKIHCIILECRRVMLLLICVLQKYL